MFSRQRKARVLFGLSDVVLVALVGGRLVHICLRPLGKARVGERDGDAVLLRHLRQTDLNRRERVFRQPAGGVGGRGGGGYRSLGGRARGRERRGDVLSAVRGGADVDSERPNEVRDLSARRE